MKRRELIKGFKEHPLWIKNVDAIIKDGGFCNLGASKCNGWNCPFYYAGELDCNYQKNGAPFLKTCLDIKNKLKAKVEVEL